MSGTVFIVGSGASASYGAPTFLDFFDKAKKIRDDGVIGVDTERFDTVINVHKKCFPSFNIEQFYSLLELEEELESSVCEKPARELKSDTLYVIGATIKHLIEKETPWEVSNFISKLRDENKDGGVTIITLNWDLLFDSYFFKNSIKINYGHESHNLDDPSDTKHEAPPYPKILKLHGSLNWLVCPEGIEDYKRIFFVKDYIIDEPSKEDEKYHRVHCVNQPSERLIVPPVFTKLSKDPKYEPIKKIWKLAEDSLIKAERIFIMGYSFPVTDTQFESFFINSLVKNKNLKKVIIETYPKYGREKMEFEDRYSSIFRHAEQYEKIDFVYLPFKEWISSQVIDSHGRKQYRWQHEKPSAYIRS